MRLRFPHRRGRTTGATESGSLPPGPGSPDLRADIMARACCCPAWPVVQVTMPPTAQRPHPVDLLLCGHHYRVSAAALAAAGATVRELPGRGDKAVAGLPAAGGRSRAKVR